MFSRFIRWSFTVILIQTGILEVTEGWAEREKIADKDSIVALTPIVIQNLEQPVYLTHAGDGYSRLFAVEQPGRIRILQEQTMLPGSFLDISERVLSGGERGLLGLAFHRDYSRNGRFFVNYTRKPDGATVIAEYQRGTTSTSASPEERILLTVPQPYPNHNGGMISFGPDGYLYISLGDGGSKGDPENRAQNPEELLGKILRIDVDRGDPYGIPPDNPFAQGGGRAEIYALGLRNPWRFSFDGKTGELWVADVGQYMWEEIDLVTRGGNYGWRAMEGTHCFNPSTSCKTPHFSSPLAEYSHERGRCSVIGGYVYRGQGLPDLTATYVYGDYCSGEIFALPSIQKDSQVNNPRQLLKTSIKISSFGEDATGELYVLDHNGGIYRLSAP
ncbi:MAG: PQQ-dependent sugar dehydrogenase [Nitrospira sp.]|nr:PQQ-dependent sugar dehydrogenase [Nitrospira sp.]MDH4370344.1 PQQ-dependent sugar dehydrogenase [Nitrospira sp.]MDH5336031.1 PQQ-dependent sugar dehydrogenase [Nitrospira sp.]MDH5497434.1 PQQ-dependent sugar dehydrogenase [Nitrospira sp.]